VPVISISDPYLFYGSKNPNDGALSVIGFLTAARQIPIRARDTDQISLRDCPFTFT
jgi:hypothetical protein